MAISDSTNYSLKGSQIKDIANRIKSKATAATTLAGYGITDAYTKTEVDQKVAGAYHYKGSVSTYADLPSSGQVAGDVYNVETADPTHSVKAGDTLAWNGTAWDNLGGVVDLSNYYTKTQVDSAITIQTVKVNGSALTPDNVKAVDVTIPITTVKVNGSALTPDNAKAVDITVPVVSEISSTDYDGLWT